MRYHAEIRRDSDGSYWAEVEELPGCFASGFTLEELNEALSEAIRLYLAAEGKPGRTARSSGASKKSSRGRRTKGDDVEVRYAIPA